MDVPATIDPATGRPLPPDAIVRILHITPKVHVYSIPRDSVATAAGYAAASWTSDPRNHIFTARLRVLETSFSTSSSSSASEEQQQQQQRQTSEEEDEEMQIKIDILLEDPSTGALFAAAPYTTPASVEPTTDSSRFFAVRVQDPTSKQKATLGVGFEERSEAFDFGVALQEAGRALRWSSSSSSSAASSSQSHHITRAVGGTGGTGGEAGVTASKGKGGGEEEEKRDLSLKEGETITVNLSGTRFGRRAGRQQQSEEDTKGSGGEEGKSLASFSLPPPPPPSAREVRAQKRLSAQQLGFDDGQFGEFA
ncbi:uncharacterized protein B0T15DRAFT_144898 [Chaetomium strumarium]|uniref:NECAP PHear domain-containing protein n=1 Tax=Chaetomium strumarium TaxID=1170767 RepID=A0AAJ0GVD5_9PEZI|nr:hypothetical protein B0T15DRAFT_144898 [Chaetomium strumarium]